MFEWWRNWHRRSLLSKSDFDGNLDAARHLSQSSAQSKHILDDPAISTSTTPAPQIPDNYVWPSSKKDAQYYKRPRCEALIEDLVDDSRTELPIRVLVVPASALRSLQSTIESFFKIDDVVSPAFLRDASIIVPNDTHTADREIECNFPDESWRPQQIFRSAFISEVPPGPYFLVGKRLHQAWRLFPDHLDSFVCGVVPNDTSPEDTKSQMFDTLCLGLGVFKAIAVPSRLFYPRTADKPLNGLRITVKDNFRVRNIQTTQTNRAWCQWKKVETENAYFVQHLVKLGAIVIGKTKMCSFASSEEATDGWIDFHAPFNPRADGYQSSSGSTTGGATSLAGYDWVDFSLGTDTTGSIRWPAAWNGVFGLRLTHDPLKMAGIYPACHPFDAIGFLGRSLRSLQEVAEASLGAKNHAVTIPRRILVSNDFHPYGDQSYQAMISEFISVLERSLDIKSTPISIADLWASCPPEQADGKSLKDFIKDTAFKLFYFDGFREFADFREGYQAQFKKMPYVGPYMRWKWEQGKNISQEDYDQALDELEVYQTWFQANVMRSAAASPPDTIIILPCGPTEPKYRDDPNKPPASVAAWSLNYVASMIGLPQLVLPFGQLPYESRVSGRREHLPVVGTIIGPRGSDLHLIKLATEAFDRAGWPTQVETGPYAFPLGENIRNVKDLLPSAASCESFADSVMQSEPACRHLTRGVSESPPREASVTNWMLAV